ncbi:transcriptional regulator [Salmonella enterica]|nr:transcriptional regulator [Salmonella enterica]EHM3570494.1 transcriptional regulator [Salmonella enterica]EHV1691300.1 transcriptional regulator [Salmonella enterica]EJO4826034.1 transcriptional regulator [Salmonella enterica]EJS0330221.1 transcriptional regulator [Salmonella enterica]
MRQYTINNEFIYNESLREIISLHDKKVLKVTLMRARFLSYLFENAYKKLITREMISHAVWGERSQFVSDANLTQLLYLLRRDLQQIGLFELFVTLPRQGIKIDERFIIDAADIPPQAIQYHTHRCNKIISIGIPTLFLLMVLFFLAPFI